MLTIENEISWARSLARIGHQTPNLRVPGSNPGGSVLNLNLIYFIY